MSDEKHCPDCDSWLDRSCFARNRSRYDGLQTTCKKCQSIRNSGYQRTRKREKVGPRKQKRREEVLAWLAAQGIELACDTCGEDHPAVIDFHHTDPQTKEFSISVAVRKRYSMERIIGEIKKCRQLCSNCHRKFHWEERGNQGADNGVQEATR